MLTVVWAVQFLPASGNFSIDSDMVKGALLNKKLGPKASPMPATQIRWGAMGISARLMNTWARR